MEQLTEHQLINIQSVCIKKQHACRVYMDEPHEHENVQDHSLASQKKNIYILHKKINLFLHH